MLISLFERAKVQIISITLEKMCFFAKKIFFYKGCLFVAECLILRPNFAVKNFDHKKGISMYINE